MKCGEPLDRYPYGDCNLPANHKGDCDRSQRVPLQPRTGSWSATTISARRIRTLVLTGGMIREQFGLTEYAIDDNTGLYTVLADDMSGQVWVITGERVHQQNLARRFKDAGMSAGHAE